MPIGSMIGGVISAGGASQAGGTASAAGSYAAQQAASAAHQANVLSSGYLSPYYATSGPFATSRLNALSGLGDLKWDGQRWVGSYETRAEDLKNAQAEATTAITGSPSWTLMTPYLDTLKNAVGPDKFETSPGYQFRLDQGRNALANSSNAAGMSLSGPRAKALTEFNQGTASQEYNNWVRNVAGYTGAAIGTRRSAIDDYMGGLKFLSGQGLDAAKANSGIASNSAGQTIQGLNYYMQGQNALASSQAASANAIGQGVGSAISNLGSLASFGYGQGWFGGGGGGGTGWMNQNPDAWKAATNPSTNPHFAYGYY